MWVCSTQTACGAVRWTREWMKNAVGSTVFVALEHRALGVAQDQRGGGDLRPVPAIGIDQEPVAAHHAVLVGDGQREVVAHPLVQAQPCGPAQGAGEVDALLLQAVGHAFLRIGAADHSGTALPGGSAGEPIRWLTCQPLASQGKVAPR